jgi:hypothetical protein
LAKIHARVHCTPGDIGVGRQVKHDIDALTTDRSFNTLGIEKIPTDKPAAPILEEPFYVGRASGAQIIVDHHLIAWLSEHSINDVTANEAGTTRYESFHAILPP